MSFAPQEWMADFGPLTNIIRKGNGEMDIDEMSADLEQCAVNEAVNRIFAEAQKTELEDGESLRVCEDCGERFAGKGKAKYCRACAKERRRQGIMEYIERGKKRADESKIQNPDERRGDKEAATAPVETVFVKKASPSPALEAERERKKQPIETHFGPYNPEKESDSMCDNLDLKNVPSLSNRQERGLPLTPDPIEEAAGPIGVPEIGPDGKQTGAWYTPADNGTTSDMQDITDDKLGEILRSAMKTDRKAVLLAVYHATMDVCKDGDMTVAELLDRMRRIDEALS